MITADVVDCSTMLVPPDGGREPNNWTTGTTCYIPATDPWEFGWDGLVAIFTILALVAAGFAWWEARRANHIATATMERSVEHLQVQIEADRSAIMNQLQLEQLAKYSEALLWFINHSIDTTPEQEGDLRSNEPERIEIARKSATLDLEERKRELVTHWAAWSMYLLAIDPELRIATSNHMDGIGKWAAARLGEKLQIIEDQGSNQILLAEKLQGLVHEKNFNAYFQMAGNTLANVQCIMVRGENWKNLRKYIINQYPEPTK